ncbi:MAG: pyruvate kinase [Anaerolineae bacterium]|nr:pyruvate kinase [Anaerolineae bacterium]
MASPYLNAKRTKIVATIGPDSSSDDTLRAMIRAGMNVARINFSHGSHADHAERIARIRRIAAEENTVVAILSDIQGPKIRIGKIDEPGLDLKKGDKITLTLDAGHTGQNNTVTLPHREFMVDIRDGMSLLLDDGNFELLVLKTDGRSLLCEVVIDGRLTSNKGVMAPTARHQMRAITEKDRQDVEFALSQGTDFIAMSFVRTADDIREMRWLITHLGGRAALIAKIEKHEALENINDIIAATDGIMVARGDMGLEVGPERVPHFQKRIIALCNRAAKPVITATQMLSSMTDSPRPTRAEASDVYNAILDGTDAVMLSNETAKGNYPVDAVKVMSNIAHIAEAHLHEIKRNVPDLRMGEERIADSISNSTYTIAESLNARAIITASLSGTTAQRVSALRPKTPILCVTPDENTYRRLALVWGVIPLLVPQFTTIDEMLHEVVTHANAINVAHANDILVIVAGVPFGRTGATNLIKVHRVGDGTTSMG